LNDNEIIYDVGLGCENKKIYQGRSSSQEFQKIEILSF